MIIKRFVILEEQRKLFYNRRALYGYSFQNHTIYKVHFGPNIESASKFYSESDANRFLDELPPNDYVLHICSSQCKAPIKLSNLVVMPLSIVYDS